MNIKLIGYTLVAALGGLLFGFDTAVINGALPFFSEFFQLDDIMVGWAVSAALVGCIVGAAFVGKPGDKFGRRYMLKIMAILFLLSALATGFATSTSIFIFGRFIGGVAVGGASVISPMYISEIAPAKFRGRLTMTFQLAIVIGILLAFFTDFILIDTGKNNWRFMFLSMAIPALAFYMLLFFVAKSPRWLVQKKQMDEALKVVSDINVSDNPDDVLKEIQQSVQKEKATVKVPLFKKPYKRLIFIGIMIGIFSQLTGIGTVMYYATDIFREAGFSTNSAIGQTVIIGLTNLVFTILSMFLIDRIGRKQLLMIGTLGMSVFLGLFAYSFISGAVGGWILVSCLIGYVAFFASSVGAVVWVLLAEIFPNVARSRGLAIASFTNWATTGLIQFLFPIIVGYFNGGLGIGYVFGFFALMTFSSFFLYKKFLFETKNKTLEQIESEQL